MVTLMLVKTEHDGDVLVECDAKRIKPGMLVEYDGFVGVVKNTLECVVNSDVYCFACALMRHQNVPYQANRVYSQCWEACPG